ncbi:Erd1p SCDLUD_003293 [Saccharomycodes ludwigii]|uniref:Erd1p n=1 Tax=Saccharomycodes ludwigii TaxID=36035 RepID=UPI001E8B6470|nr:hypothetical protein SCDLUD_003293 [Saccharomycodes ludwigii]KAH3900321.1 hypothetical protein SCDLUD_003293 [Saccharomycodes ludwigii]
MSHIVDHNKKSVLALLLPSGSRLPALVLIGLWMFYLQLKILNKKLLNLNNLLCYDYSALGSTGTNDDATHMISRYRKPLVKATKIVIITHVIYIFILLIDRSKHYFDTTDDIVYNSTIESFAFLINLTPLLQIICILYLTCYINASDFMKHVLKKIIMGCHIESGSSRLLYILVSDTLTSYSKSIVDFTMFNLLNLFQPYSNDMEKWLISIVSLIVGVIPSTIRFVQCVREHQPFNAIKYGIHYPILFLTIKKLVYLIDQGNIDKTYNIEMMLDWVFFLHAIYSFWWDCTMDWGLELWNFTSNNNVSSTWLRNSTRFSNKTYCVIIVVDFILRFVWFWQLIFSISLDPFLLQFLEIFRRWLWIFLRLEYESWNNLYVSKE